MPEMTFVDSSNIEALGYDVDTQELHVQFVSSGLYIYSGVPREIFDELMNAPSKGSFLNREVKGIYQFVKQ
ncbi:MAG: KTSC domain-containing protein [Proteobacteria bacterium]|nr:KTSC domain-containing protein [Pseudomonadota bacterium]